MEPSTASTTADIPHLHFWQDALRAMMRNGTALLRMAGESVNDANLIRLVQSLPRSSAELALERWQAGYCNHCLATVHNVRGRDCPEYLELFEYFLIYFPERHHVAQEVLIDSVRVVLGTPGREVGTSVRQGGAEGFMPYSHRVPEIRPRRGLLGWLGRRPHRGR